MNLFVDRVRRSPKCFGMQFMAAIWTQDRTHNDMLTLHVVHKPTKRSAKLHFLTREAQQVKTMLTRYSEAVLQELQKIDKEKALRKKVEGMNKGKALTA